MTSALRVSIHGTAVGQVQQGRHGLQFWFYDSYLSMPRRPVLGQYFEERLANRRFEGKRGRLPAGLSNLVPEPGSKLRRVLAERFELDDDDELGLLAALGRDLHGAVVVQPHHQAAAPNGEPFVEPRSEGGLAFSLPGQQLKFSMSRDEHRFSLPAVGQDGEWILKMTGPGYPYAAENEHFIMTWARTAGFDVPESRVIGRSELPDLPGLSDAVETAYAVRRFDRHEGSRIHQEDFAQVLGWPPENKEGLTYDQLAKLVAELMPGSGCEEFVRRLVLMLVSGNGDAHLKNWSLLYPDRVRARWTPLYDQVSTIAWGDNTIAMKLAGDVYFGQVGRRQLLRLAGPLRLAVARVETLIDETLAGLEAAWSVAVQVAGPPEDHVSALRAHWRRSPLMSERGRVDTV